MPRLVLLLALVVAACTAGPRALQFNVARDLDSDLSASDTELVLRAMRESMGGDAAGRELTQILVTSIRAENGLALIDGCGTFGGWTFPVKHQVVASAVHEGGAWKLHHWEVAKESLHGEPLPCSDHNL